ncbi:MAG: mechanosensitive ion channel family protein [Campylobacterota bacterium]|nr:mechanosensitive ion channel family protein [Campylobacterota bacterium]
MKDELNKEIENMQNLYNVIIEFFVNYSFQIIGAVIILLLGFYVAKKVSDIAENFFLRKEFDVTLTKFIATAIRIAIIAGTAIIALGKLGITVTPFVAAIGAMSLGAGLALQGLLSNFGAGVSIIATRPFVVGNTITIQGYTGLVKIIKLGYTILETEDKEEITIPNKHIIGEILQNSFEYTVVETIVGIDYGSDPKKAISVISDILNSYSELSKDTKAQVGIKEFADASINIELRYWAPTARYNETQYKINMDIFDAFEKNNIVIPYPTYNIIKK